MKSNRLKGTKQKESRNKKKQDKNGWKTDINKNTIKETEKKF